MAHIIQRNFDPVTVNALAASGIAPALARILAARGITHARQLEPALSGLIPPEILTNNTTMARLLADAIAQEKSLLVIGDYDADGATATALAVRGLRSMGAQVEYLVPNRFEYGYGLTPEIVALAAQQFSPDIIITVDNGIASVDGVLAAHALGMQVLITDHHLPGDVLPAAACILNPNQPGCGFPSKHLAGVGVMFYALLALRAELRRRGAFAGAGSNNAHQPPEPNLSAWLDLVALGTVADLVRLDDNNRILVEQGLRRIRAGKACAGIRALFAAAGRDATRASAQDMGFSIGPRLNAAGRLEDMSVGIACLLCDDEVAAQALAQRLDALNSTRRDIEADMQKAARLTLEEIDASDRYSLSLYDAAWHQGVIGILASRIKERYHRPVFAFARADTSLAENDAAVILKGSGRSIRGLHLRDALDLLSKREPDLLIRFGGHAMAAGLSILERDFERFNLAFESVVRKLLTPTELESVIETDGPLAKADMHWDMAVTLERQLWGQGFPPPMFHDDFNVVDQRIVGERHLKLTLERDGSRYDAIFFQQQELLPERIAAVYQLQTNEYKGKQSVQLRLVQFEAALAGITR